MNFYKVLLSCILMGDKVLRDFKESDLVDEVFESPTIIDSEGHKFYRVKGFGSGTVDVMPIAYREGKPVEGHRVVSLCHDNHMSDKFYVNP